MVSSVILITHATQINSPKCTRLRRGAHDSAKYYATMLFATPLPHLNLRKLPELPLATSRPQDPPSRTVVPFSPDNASPLPTSRPITYPAPNPTTETKTTTPALITHVNNVGDIMASSTSWTFFFFAILAFSPDGLAPLAFRFPLSIAAASWLEMLGLLRARVEGVKGLEELAAFDGGPMSSDSGTKRRDIGSLFVMPVLLCSRFGRPRAAAAPIERRVVREARSAAS